MRAERSSDGRYMNTRRARARRVTCILHVSTRMLSHVCVCVIPCAVRARMSEQKYVCMCMSLPKHIIFKGKVMTIFISWCTRVKQTTTQLSIHPSIHLSVQPSKPAGASQRRCTYIHSYIHNVCHEHMLKWIFWRVCAALTGATCNNNK